jgi:hypothetical protein
MTISQTTTRRPPAFVIGGSLFCCLLSVASLIGCGDKSATVPVSGGVSYQGERLPGGVVTFFPATGRPLSASVSPSGQYSTSLPPGEYAVTVMVGFDRPPGYKEGDPLPPPKIELPAEYTSRALSKLSASVKAEGPQTIDFALE